MKSLDSTEYKMPSEIAKETNLQPSQVSHALNDLKNRDLVMCLNENAKKDRLYEVTDIFIIFFSKFMLFSCLFF